MRPPTVQPRPVPRYRKKARPEIEPGFPHATWSLGEALLVFFVSAAIGGVASILAYIGLDQAGISPMVRDVLTLFISSCALYGPLLIGTYISVGLRHGRNQGDLGLTTMSLGSNIRWGFTVGVPILIGALTLVYFSQWVFGPTTRDVITEPVKEMTLGQGDIVMLAILVIVLVIFAPICEEIYFRGYLYPVLRNKLGKQPGLLINALLFSLIHFRLIALLPLFLVGYGLAYIYEKKRSLVCPIVAHAFYNAAILVLAFVFHIY